MKSFYNHGRETDEMDLEKIKQIRDKITNEINSYDDSLLSKFPPSEYIKLSDSYPTVHDYQYVSPEIKNYTGHIIQTSNENILELYHKVILLDLISRNMATIEKDNIPESVKVLYIQNFQRITDNIEADTEASGFYLHQNDKFLKDWGVCAKWIIPVGATKINVDRISKKFLLKKDLWQLIRGSFYIIFKLGGFEPLYVMHTDSHDPASIGDFNQEGFNRLFLRVAQLLKINKNIKGLYCMGWLNDPELSEISPRLAFARTIFTDNGGVVFYLGPSQNAVESATLKSATRRQLYQEGKYIPTEYLAIWSRKKLIEWADNFTKS